MLFLFSNSKTHHVVLGFFVGALLLVCLPVGARPSEKEPRVSNLPPQNFFFVGRKESLQGIKDFFNKSPVPILAVTGPPGFGKTELAVQYAHTTGSHYDVVWVFNASQKFGHQFTKLALSLNEILPEKDHINPSQMMGEALVSHVMHILKERNIRYLLIFDNVLSHDHIKSHIPGKLRKQRNKDILMTSRNPNLWPHVIEIEKFKRAESAQFIHNTLKKEGKKEINHLAQAHDDCPIGLAIATGFIKSHPTLNIKSYLTKYHKRPLQKAKGLAPPCNILLNNYTSCNVEEPLSVSLEAIRSESRETMDVLFFISLLNPKDIPKEYIDIWITKTKRSPHSPTSDEAIRLIYQQSLVKV